MRKLARGGMGAVYLARTEGAEGFARPVVVKRVLPTLMDDEEVAQMFVREARILSELQHPNIVPVLDFGQDRDGAYVMVLDYVNGYHLGQWARYCQKFKAGIPCEMVLYIMGRVLEALHYAHTLTRSDGKTLQIIHRDVTPSNVLLDLQGNVRLLDFGIARVSGDETGIVTQRPQVKGKLPYLALEIFQGKDPSAASDIYSVGVVLYELLTGNNPFMGRETADIFHKVLHENLASVHAVRDDAPEEIDEVLGRAVNRDPRARFKTAAEFAEALAAMRRRSDSAIAEDLRKQLRQDFQGRMPKELKLEPLSVRDAAWRSPVPGGLSDFSPATPEGTPSMPVTEDLPLPDGMDVPTVQADVPEHLLQGTSNADQAVTVPPPGRASREGVSQLRIPAPPALGIKTPLAPPPSGLEPPAPSRTDALAEDDRVTVPDPQQAAQPSATRPSSPGRRSRAEQRSPALWAVAIVAVAVSGASLWFSLSRIDGGGEREIVVIEKQGGGAASVAQAAPAPPPPQDPEPAALEPEPTAAPEVPEAEADGPAETAEPVPEPAAPKRATKRSAPQPPDPRALTRRFGRKQARIEACFREHAAGLEGRPQLSVKFLIDATGKVKAADLTPAASAATPLGRCVLSVAKGTRFGPQQREFSFSIPITARVVQ